MQVINAFFYIAILVMSVVIHEVSHGFVAERFGDKTARYAGRLTLNPLKHLDPFGSVLLPAILYIFSGFVFGWAKPVPYNPENLTNKKWGTICIAAAGVLANLFVAVFFGLILRFGEGLGLSESFNRIVYVIVITNLTLAVFNLVPIPPLDGSKILFSLLPRSFNPIVSFIEQYALIFLIILLVFFIDYLYPIVILLYYLIVLFTF